MADTFIAFPPDSTDPNAKRVVFNQNTIPGISGNVFYQYVRLAQPPTYIAVSDNIPSLSGKIHLALYNKTSRRLRVEHVYAHPHTNHASGTNTVLQVGITVTEPTDGNDISVRKFASDFADAPVSGVIVKSESTVSPVPGYIVGGSMINTQLSANVPRDTATLFKKDIDHSSLQLLSGEGVVIRQAAVPMSGAGSISTYVLFSLDTA
jgi:hypothetical protein